MLARMIRTSKKINRPEQALHRAIADYLTLVSKAGRFWWCHYPGGGARSKVEAAILNGLGVRAGVYDILIIAPGGRAFWIELKSNKGKPSLSQKSFAKVMDFLGSPNAVCRSLDEVAAALKGWGLAR